MILGVKILIFEFKAYLPVCFAKKSRISLSTSKAQGIIGRIFKPAALTRKPKVLFVSASAVESFQGMSLCPVIVLVD